MASRSDPRWRILQGATVRGPTSSAPRRCPAQEKARAYRSIAAGSRLLRHERLKALCKVEKPGAREERRAAALAKAARVSRPYVSEHWWGEVAGEQKRVFQGFPNIFNNHS